jgi:hypothetical protein
MALGSWQGLYNAVILDLMAQQREREMLLLMAIGTHADEFGFCFPGRARLFGIRHCAKTTQLRDEAWLVANLYITVEDIEDPVRRQTRPFYQISPRVMYMRPELQEYCEEVFDGIRFRDYAWEKKLDLILRSTKNSVEDGGGLILSSTKESQPESLTRIRTRNQNQTQDQKQNQTQNQRGSAPRQNGRTATTTRSDDQREAPTDQRRKAQDRKNNPQVGGPDEFDALLSPNVDDARLVKEIVHVASTTEYQAQDAVATFPREGIVHWLRITAQRRAKGQLNKPGGWFFRMLQTQVAPIEIPEQHTSD